jgi:hypothetical protein
LVGMCQGKMKMSGFHVVVTAISGIGAGDGIRTRDFQLGKLTLYH